MSEERAPRWVQFLIRHDTGKTFVWVVRAKQDAAELGEIRWFGRDIAGFIEAQMRARREAKPSPSPARPT